MSALQWVEHKRVNHYTGYELVIAYGNTVSKGLLAYDPNKVQWVLSTQSYAMSPTGGLVRWFTCCDLSLDRMFVFVGTSAGEMCVFRRDSAVFRVCIPVCANSLQSIAVLPNDDVVCAGGDGSLHRLQGRDLSWRNVVDVSIRRFCFPNPFSINIFTFKCIPPARPCPVCRQTLTVAFIP